MPRIRMSFAEQAGGRRDPAGAARWMRAGLLALLAMSEPALANHPGDRLGEAMAAKESSFEHARRNPPGLQLRAVDGTEFDLRDLEEKVVVLSFVPAGCGTSCADQQALLARVREAVNDTLMRDLAAFVTVMAHGSPTAAGGGDADRLDLVPREDGAVAELRADWARMSDRGAEGPIAYVLGRGAQEAGLFHGSGFARVNMIRYINGLTNAHPPEPGPLDRIRRFFE
ncbi:cytochrome-c oxidase [uncultured Jannaschia sp.]|uniref:cytochrome-c oxidase n=1 Tax=uncultured Jannaschia sp. TaxID=293347 RepID=UPI0026212F8F|nr:cytochrome-c oxidase [uncultured Jannaschia sp.]